MQNNEFGTLTAGKSKFYKKGLGMKSLKHAKIRDGHIHVSACIKNVRYRFSTRLKANAKNLLHVENNYLEYIDRYVKEKQRLDLDASIATYGREILETHCNDCKESTYIRYSNIFNKYIVDRIGHLRLAHVKPKHARDIFARFADLSNTNRGLVLNLLKLIFSNAVLDELVFSNPFSELKNIRSKLIKEDTHKPFTQKEMNNILLHCETYHLRLYFYIAFFTGMRPNEILALKANDIDLESGHIFVNKSLSLGKVSTTKTHRIRHVEIIEPLRLFLEKYLLVSDKNGFLFVGRHNKFISDRFISNHFEKILSKLNIENTTLYATRHTFATLMLQSGEDMQWISNQLGHRDLSTTLQHYIKYIKTDKVRGRGFTMQVARNLEKMELS